MMGILGAIAIFIGGMQLLNGAANNGEAMKSGLITVAIGIGCIYVANL